VDAEISRILRQQEERAIELLRRHRAGLDAVARALLERETLDGSEVGGLVDTAYGRPVHDTPGLVTQFTTPNGTGLATDEVSAGNGAEGDTPTPEPETTGSASLKPRD
jgi:cell division protease FtsH